MWLVGAALLGAVILAAAHFSEQQEFARLLDRARPGWLLVAALLQAGTYLAETEVWRPVARAAGYTVPLGRVYRLSLAKLFIDQAIPSGGVSGTLLYVRGLEQAGLARPTTLAGVVIATFSYYAAYIACLVTALVPATAGRTRDIPITAVAIAFLVAITAFAIVVLLYAGREPGAVGRRLAKVPVMRGGLQLLRRADPDLARNPRLLGRAVLAQIAIFLLDTATLGVCLLAVGVPAQPVPVFASYMLSSLLRTVSVVPGGLGAFEGAATYLLHMEGIEVPAALSATLLFRGLSFWLPMVPGFVFARQAARLARGT